MNASAQTVYALRVLRTRGLADDVLQHIYRATVVARLTYAASAWYDLTKASDRKRIDSVLDGTRRHGYCPLDLPTFDELCHIADDELFSRAMRLSNHVLHALIPLSLLHHRDTILDTVHTYYSCRHTPHACQTLTLLHECSTKTNIRHRKLLSYRYNCITCCVSLACVLSRPY